MAMVQIVSYGFTTVENPLSNGGNFSTAPSRSSLQVPNSGVCEPTTSGSVSNIEYWSGAVPTGDTGGTWPADHYSEITVRTGVLADSMEATVRQSSGANTAYLLAFQVVTAAPVPVTAFIYAIVAGSVSAQDSFSITVAANDVIRLTATGTSITVNQNGTLVRTFADSNIAGPGFPGLGVFAVSGTTATTISNWAGGANQAATPTFSPVAGSYSGTQTITISSATAGGTIYYTRDGSTPTRSSSSISNGGTISVPSTQTVKAIGSVSGYVDSAAGSAAYTITAGGGTGGGGTLRLRRRNRANVI
jgi:hypothetical protein